MSLNVHPAPYFVTGSPITDEYLASYTFPNGTSLPYPGMLGQVVQFDQGTTTKNICVFQLVKAASAITPAEGAVLYWSDKTIFEVTTTVTGQQLAGIAPKLMAAAASYFWMIKKGDDKVLLKGSPTATAAAGTQVIPSSTAGSADTITAAATTGNFPVIGVALGAATSNLVNTRINIPDQF